MSLRVAQGTLALLLAVGCQDRAVTANQATDITNNFLAENEPIELASMTIEAVDMGDRWRISYAHPEGGTGGPIIFVVNKRSGKIVHMETEQ